MARISGNKTSKMENRKELRPMKNEPKVVHLVCYELSDKEQWPENNDFDNLDGENVLWCQNHIDQHKCIKYIKSDIVLKLVEQAYRKGLQENPNHNGLDGHFLMTSQVVAHEIVNKSKLLK